jgi:hypothetical protein
MGIDGRKGMRVLLGFYARDSFELRGGGVEVESWKVTWFLCRVRRYACTPPNKGRHNLTGAGKTVISIGSYHALTL